MKKNVIDWAGEARGTSDVVFTRLCNLERNYVQSLSDNSEVWQSTMMKTILNTMDIEDCVMALVYKCEQENKKLVDILEEVLTIKKEYYSKD
jgi:hypothetical protein